MGDSHLSAVQIEMHFRSQDARNKISPPSLDPDRSLRVHLRKLSDIQNIPLTVSSSNIEDYSSSSHCNPAHRVGKLGDPPHPRWWRCHPFATPSVSDHHFQAPSKSSRSAKTFPHNSKKEIAFFSIQPSVFLPPLVQRRRRRHRRGKQSRELHRRRCL